MGRAHSLALMRSSNKDLPELVRHGHLYLGSTAAVPADAGCQVDLRTLMKTSIREQKVKASGSRPHKG